MRALPLLLALALVACKADKDGDGYDEDDDCNDEQDDVYPNAGEVCDGVDNDCDGDVDEGVTGTWYQDADSDGYGDPAATTDDCGQPDGYVANDRDCDDTSDRYHPGAEEGDCTDPEDYNCDGSTGYVDEDGDGHAACDDCDDGEPAVNPSADEVCDEIDNDCNGITDYPAIDAPTWYIDYDHDTYGSDAFTIVQCTQPGGYVDNDDDCDDFDANALPGGTEVCDGLDNDCDGTVDGGDAADAVTAYQDADGDGYGDPATEAKVCELVGILTEETGDCDDTNAAVNPAALEVCNDGVDDDCDGGWKGCELGLDEADVILLGEEPGDYAGTDVAAGGDLNGDGAEDIVVGASENDAGAEGTEGAAYVAFGPLTAGSTPLDDADLKLGGVEGGDAAGDHVAIIGDYDGDGIDDLVVTATTADDGATNSGSAYVLLGSTLAAASAGDALSLSDADWTWTGSDAYDWLGEGLAPAGDADGDGFDDFFVGAAGDEIGGTASGSIYLLPGADDSAWGGESTVGSAAAIVTGDTSALNIGAWLEGGLDLDSDGAMDLLVGAKQADANGVASGAVYVLAGPLDGTTNVTDSDACIVGTDAGDRAGAWLAVAGDTDADGYPDLLAGAVSDDEGAADAGAIYLVPGTATISGYDGVDLDTLASAKIISEASAAGLGAAFSDGADYDGDGHIDFLAGLRSAGTDGEGAAYLFLGPISGTLSTDIDDDATLMGDTSNDHNGSTVTFAGDLLGIGHNSIVVAGWEDDGAGLDAGSVFVLGEVDGG